MDISPTNTMKMIMPHSESVGTDVGGMGGTTVKVAMAGRVLLPLLVCKASTGSVLRKLPPNGAVTFTVTVQVPAMPPLYEGRVSPVL